MPELFCLELHGHNGFEPSDATRRTFETEVLPAYLARQRWYGKSERPRHAHLRYAIRMANIADAFLAEVDVTLDASTQAQSARYFVPFVLQWDDVAQASTSPFAIARVQRDGNEGVLLDAFGLESFAHACLQNMRLGHGATTAVGSQHGPITLSFLPEAGLADTQVAPDSAVKRFTGEQSNSSLLLGGQVMLKLVRHVADGVHPEAEMTRHLTRMGYRHCAAMLGELSRRDSEEHAATLALAHANIPNEGDAWSWTLSHLQHVVTGPAATGHMAGGKLDWQAYGTVASAIGTRLAQLHDVLSAPSEDPAFAPHAATQQDGTRWAEDILDMLNRAREALAQAHSEPATASDRERVLSLGARLDDAIRRSAAHLTGTLQIRIHGDFHLGQVLVSGTDAYLIDFEGEPARALDARRLKLTPLRDVAGLLRSFDYARAAFARDAANEPDTRAPAASSLTAQGTESGASAPSRAEALDAFHQHAEAAFLRAYKAAAAQASHPWIDEASLDRLLPLALLEKAAYEVVYEASHRPSWLGIPLAGLAERAAQIVAADQPD